MDRVRRSGVVALVLAVAVVLGGCSAKQPETAHRGSVDSKTQQQVISALTSAGATPEATTQLRMSWKQGSTNTVIVDGSFANPNEPTSSAASLGVYEVTRESDGTWSVRKVQ